MNGQQSGYQALAGAVSTQRLRAEELEIQQEAAARGVSVWQVAREWRAAEQERRQADGERVRALIADPATLRALRAQWAIRPVGSDSAPSSPEEPEPETPETPARDPHAPPSAGRLVNPAKR
jgi:hypothetical protein